MLIFALKLIFNEDKIMTIPKIIHQVWEEKTEPLPDFLMELGQTWKEQHPDWTYLFWDEEKIASFMSGGRVN